MSSSDLGEGSPFEVFFDYTCPYANRARHWLDPLARRVEWRTFSLLEANRDDDGPPVWRRPDLTNDISLLALAGHQAVETAGGAVDAYRSAFFDAWHHTDRRLDRSDVVDFATEAGVAPGDVDLGEGFERVGAEHAKAVELGVFGSPTLVFPHGEGRYLRLTGVPDDGDALLRSVEELVLRHPEVDELQAVVANRRGVKKNLLDSS